MNPALPPDRAQLTNRQLILPYALPYLAYVGIAALLGDLLSREVNYALRIVAVALLLLWARRWYCPLRGPGSAGVSLLVGTAAGLFGAALWIFLLSPFAARGLGADPDPWPIAAFLLRLAAAGLLVPLFEELLMRGFIFRLALQWDEARKAGDRAPLQTALDERSADDVPPGAWSWPAVLVSTVVFTAGHQLAEWPASLAFGLLMALLWVFRRDLLSCVAAHAVANIALAGYVLATGSWHLW